LKTPVAAAAGPCAAAAPAVATPKPVSQKLQKLQKLQTLQGGGAAATPMLASAPGALESPNYCASFGTGLEAVRALWRPVHPIQGVRSLTSLSKGQKHNVFQNNSSVFILRKTNSQKNKEQLPHRPGS
jgi:hypothetical protein